MAVDGAELLQRLMDGEVLRTIAYEARASVPRGDREAALSAFLSDVAAEQLTKYLPEIWPVEP